MDKAVPVIGPRRGLPLHRLLSTSFKALLRACASGSGRRALEEVRLPQGIPESRLGPRARRLMRQAQISPW